MIGRRFRWGGDVSIARGRKAKRRLGLVLLVAGLALVAYASTTLLWRDPVTDLYARWQQHKLAASLDEAFREYRRAEAARAAVVPRRPRVGKAELIAAERRAIAASSRRLQADLELGEPLGRLIIGRLGLSVVIVHGTRWGPDLSRGPGHYPETPLPGVERPFAIAGHRTTFGAPFRYIDTLRLGDMIELRLPYATFKYRVFAHEIVDDEDWSIIRSRGYDTIVLSACHPLYSASQRWIVHGRLVWAKRPQAAHPVALPGNPADT